MAWLENIVANIFGLSEQGAGDVLSSASIWFLIIGVILAISYFLPIKGFSNARLIIGGLFIISGIAIMFYMANVYDPDFLGKDGPQESILSLIRSGR